VGATVGGPGGERLGQMSAAEWEAVLQLLSATQNHRELWQLAQEAPPRWWRRLLLARVLDDFPRRRHMLQHLGHVLADLAQRGAAAAPVRGRRRIYEAFARQMRRQRTPRRPLALEGYDVDFGGSGGLGRSELGLRLRLRRIRFQVSEFKLKLLQDGATLRGLPELRVAQLRDRELQLLDQQRVGLSLRSPPPRRVLPPLPRASPQRSALRVAPRWRHAQRQAWSGTNRIGVACRRR